MLRNAGRAFIASAAMMGATMACADTAQITGTATYLQRIALPEGAELTVTLQDVSKMDVAAEILAETTIEIAHVPAEFELTYDVGDIQEGMRYTVSASISSDTGPMFGTTSANPVLTNGAGNHVDLVLDLLPASAKASLEGSWTVIDLNGAPLADGQTAQITFADGTRVGLFAGCNRFSGGVEVGDGTLDFSPNMAGTLMACPDDLAAFERAFLDALSDVTLFEHSGDQLVLSNSEGEVRANLKRE